MKHGGSLASEMQATLTLVPEMGEQLSMDSPLASLG
jgi:hypothetical protein